MSKKIIIRILLLVIATQLFATTGSFAHGIDAGSPRSQSHQKRLKKKISIREKGYTRRRTSHSSATTRKGIASAGLPGTEVSSRPATTRVPCFDETSDLHLSADFKKHKGQLSWPLSGTVSMPFGPYEYMPKIRHDNVGITVDAAEGTVVKAVYQGEVTAIESIGGVWCVILCHGKYRSAYSNLATTTVVKGQHVSAGEELGCIGDTGQLEFLLMNDNGQYVDPKKWLKR